MEGWGEAVEGGGGEGGGGVAEPRSGARPRTAGRRPRARRPPRGGGRLGARRRPRAGPGRGRRSARAPAKLHTAPDGARPRGPAPRPRTPAWPAGEIIPQAICSRYGVAIGAAVAPAVSVLMIVCAPVSWPLGWVLHKVLGREDPLFPRQQLPTILSLHGKDAGARATSFKERGASPCGSTGARLARRRGQSPWPGPSAWARGRAPPRPSATDRPSHRRSGMR